MPRHDQHVWRQISSHTRLRIVDALVEMSKRAAIIVEWEVSDPRCRIRPFIVAGVYHRQSMTCEFDRSVIDVFYDPDRWSHECELITNRCSDAHDNDCVLQSNQGWEPSNAVEYRCPGLRIEISGIVETITALSLSAGPRVEYLHVCLC